MIELRVYDCCGSCTNHLECEERCYGPEAYKFCGKYSKRNYVRQGHEDEPQDGKVHHKYEVMMHTADTIKGYINSLSHKIDVIESRGQSCWNLRENLRDLYDTYNYFVVKANECKKDYLEQQVRDDIVTNDLFEQSIKAAIRWAMGCQTRRKVKTREEKNLKRKRARIHRGNGSIRQNKAGKATVVTYETDEDRMARIKQKEEFLERIKADVENKLEPFLRKGKFSNAEVRMLISVGYTPYELIKSNERCSRRGNSQN